MLLDSNIIIYAARPEHEALRRLIRQRAPAVSIISYIEVMGYHRLGADDRDALAGFFRAAEMLSLSEEIAQRATALRQRQRMTLGDAIIAATALVHELPLLTHNASDFSWIEALRVIDPLTEPLP